MTRIQMTGWIVVATLAAATASAETLYRRDGVMLERTVWMVIRAAGSGESTPPHAMTKTPQAPGPAFELPSAIQSDRYLLLAEQAARDGDISGDRAESGKVGPAGGGTSCEGQAEGVECWKELASHPGCFLWDDHYYTDQTVTWSGGCSDGLASGTGTLTWVRDGKEDKHSGILQEGKWHGHWVLRFASGSVEEGLYVVGKRHGNWVGHHANGTVSEGPYVEGKRHGHWAIREANGTVGEGPYLEGKRNGRWVLRKADGSVREGPWVDDKRHGHWVLRAPNGVVNEGPFVDNKRHGHWVLRAPNGTVSEGPFVDDKPHGRWVIRSSDGKTQTITFVDGERQ